MTPSLPRMPDTLRPHSTRPPRRRRRSVAVLLAAFAAATLVLPMWRVQHVTMTPCRGVPATTPRGLQRLEGEWVPLLDLHWVRRQVAQWPGVGGVEVELQLPGTLRIVAHPAEAAGSVATGRRWHAVTAAGELAGSLASPVAPLLEGFRQEPHALRTGLTAAARLAEASGRRADRVRQILPDDLLVVLAGRTAEEPPLEVHVTPGGSAAEHRFWALMADRSAAVHWADLRNDNRMTLGDAS